MSVHDYLHVDDPRFTFQQCGHRVRSLECDGITGGEPWCDVYELRADELWRKADNDGPDRREHATVQDESGCDICTECERAGNGHVFADFIMDFRDGMLVLVRRRIEKELEDGEFYEYAEVWRSSDYVKPPPQMMPTAQESLNYARSLLDGSTSPLADVIRMAVDAAQNALNKVKP